MQITYKDKVTLQSNSNIPDGNKVTAEDMNEIKSVVNSNEEEQQALNMSVQEIAQNVVNNSQEISNIKEEQTTQNDNIQTNSNNISDLQSNKADKNEIPTDLSQLSNDNTKFVNETGLENAISQEKTQRQNADNNLQNQVDTNKTNIQTNATNIATNTQEINRIKAEQTTQNNRLNNLETDNTTNKDNISANTQEINNIKQEQTTQNTNISTNATNIESLQEENDNLKKIVSQLPQVEGQGTSITLEDTIEAQFTKFDVEGNSTQETTTGKNKVDVTSGNLYSVPETLTLTQREDGRLFLNGKMNGTTTQLIFNMNFANIENGKTYKIVTKVVSGTWAKSIIGMQFRNSNGQQIQTLQNSSSAQESKVIEGDVAEVRLYFGGTFEATNLVIEIMLVEASVTDDSFEKFTYGASPNPNYEQPIYSAGDNENYLKEEWEQGAYSGSNGVGKIDSNQYVRSKEFSTIEPNKEYTSKCVVNGVEHTQGNIFFYKEDESFISSITNISSTFTTPENAKKVKYNIFKSSGITPEDVDYAKLEKGNKASGYSPYGMGSINEKINNKNLFVIKNYSKSGWKITIDNPLKGMPAGDYTISCQNKSSAGGIRTYFSNEPSGAVIGNLFTDFQFGNTLMFRKETLTQEELNAKYLILYFNSNNGSQSVLEDMQIMIEQGSTVTSYVPHEEQDYSIFVQQPMRSIGDVRDCFVKKSDGWYERHYIGRKIFDGTENWIYLDSRGNYYRFYLINFSSGAGIKPVVSNFFIDRGNSAIGEYDFVQSSGNEFYLQIENKTSVAELKAWLAEQYANGTPVYVDYILAEPLDLPCTEEQVEQLENKPSTYKDFTYVVSEDEIEAYLEVSGIYDLNKLITRTEVLESES